MEMKINSLGNPLIGRRAEKMNGAGNRILVMDLRGLGRALSPAEASAIHRGPGLGFDQLMAIFEPRSDDSAAFVRIYNNDGGEAGACGNGTRCVAEYLLRDTRRNELTLETVAGLLACNRLNATNFCVDMGPPKLGWRDIPLSHSVPDTANVDLGAAYAAPGAPAMASMVSMGNPHAVTFVENVAALDLAALGPAREHHPLFPERANISFAQVEARDLIHLWVWERGVGATLACGSGACATQVAAVRAGLTDRRARVRLPGGELLLQWRESDSHVLMTGPVEFEREIILDAGLFRDIAA